MPGVRLDWDDERDAAFVLRHFLGGTVTPRDPRGGANQIHDFDLSLPDGRTVPVEVTRHTSEAYQARLGAAERMQWHFENLRFDWHVGMLPGFRVKQIHRDLPGLLRRLEDAGRETLLVQRELEDNPSGLVEELDSLGARIVYRLGDADERGGLIDLGDAPVAGVTAADLVVHVASLHAALTDNQAKLAAASDADERHLFIWVESDQHAVTAAMSGPLPIGAPSLDPLIDSVWLATGFRTSRVWRLSQTAGWSDVGSVELSP